MQDYARGSQYFDNSVKLALFDLPYLVDSPKELRERTPDQMQENAVVARRVLESHAQFTAVVNGGLGVWPKRVQQKIMQTHAFSNDSGRCFFRLGARINAQTSESWEQIKPNAAEPCSGLLERKRHNIFLNANSAVLDLMREELKNSHNDLIPLDSSADYQPEK